MRSQSQAGATLADDRQFHAGLPELPHGNTAGLRFGRPGAEARDAQSGKHGPHECPAAYGLVDAVHTVPPQKDADGCAPYYRANGMKNPVGVKPWPEWPCHKHLNPAFAGMTGVSNGFPDTDALAFVKCTIESPADTILARRFFEARLAKGSRSRVAGVQARAYAARPSCYQGKEEQKWK